MRFELTPFMSRWQTYDWISTIVHNNHCKCERILKSLPSFGSRRIELSTLPHISNLFLNIIRFEVFLLMSKYQTLPVASRLKFHQHLVTNPPSLNLLQTSNQKEKQANKTSPLTHPPSPTALLHLESPPSRSSILNMDRP